MSETESRPVPGTTDIAPRRLGLGLPRLRRQLARRPSTVHAGFAPERPAYAEDWRGFSSQRHLRDIDVDVRRGWMWMATWGGVLCWESDTGRCTRHTSAHGLIGNATRSLAVDRSGRVWAGGQHGGLCILDPDDGAPWRPHRDLGSWTVLRLAPRPQGGVYAALRDARGNCAVGEIGAPQMRLRLIARGGLETKEIEALLVDDDETLWVGNTWGVFYQKDGALRGFSSFDLQVGALAPGLAGGLWVGTNLGVYRFHTDRDPPHTREEGWPRDRVVSLTVEPETGSLWVATVRELGRVVDNAWQPLHAVPPGLLNELLTANPTPEERVTCPGSLFREHRTWAGGAGGLFDVGVDEHEPAFTPDAEDGLSNAVQSLWVTENELWVGAARGLYRFDGEAWWRYEDDVPALLDVRALLPGRSRGRMWVGSWVSGLHRFQAGVYVPDQLPAGPIVALARGDDGTLWAARPDEILRLAPGSHDWSPLEHPARAALRGGVIQAMLAVGDELWVGTSSGLLRYRPQVGLWDWAPGEIEGASVQTLALEPHTGGLWAGAATGLYRAPDWARLREADVRALAFDPAIRGGGVDPAIRGGGVDPAIRDGGVWAGTSAGLARWSLPDQGQPLDGEPLAHYTPANSGLAGHVVTALALRVVGEERELWVGSTAGLSRLRYWM